MDVGCYGVHAARFVAGAEPLRAHAERVVGGDGVDVRLAATLRFPDDLIATIDCAFDAAPRSRLEVVGSAGYMVLADPWHGQTPGIEVFGWGAKERVATEAADAYRLELEDFAAAVAGSAEPLLGRSDAVGQARALELIYSNEEDR